MIVEGQQPEIVPVKVTVTEGKHRKVNFGVGYGSEEKARGSIDWRHVNFFGGARTLQLEGGYSALSKGARVNFRQPYIFGPRYNFVTTAQSWHRNEPAYDLEHAWRAGDARAHVRAPRADLAAAGDDVAVADLHQRVPELRGDARRRSTRPSS